MASLSRPSWLVALGVLAAAALAAQAKDDKPHWAYHGRHGAQAWGNLEPGFAACKRGKLQSPIDIRDAHAKKSGTPAIRFGYLAARGRIFNNGHTIQVNMPAAGGAVLGDSDYQLLQFHFHAPGEERINGRRHPMSLHMVHRNARGQLAVIALLLKEGKENPALKPVFDRLPAKPGDRRSLTGFNPADMLPADRGYYRFKGSLTTPPCSEEVSWHVLKQPVEISKAQLRAFRKLYPMNARPVQPLNGRTVETN